MYNGFTLLMKHYCYMIKEIPEIDLLQDMFTGLSTMDSVNITTLNDDLSISVQYSSDNDSDDSSISHLSTNKRKEIKRVYVREVSLIWKILPQSDKDEWSKRAKVLNQYPCPGNFTTIPTSLLTTYNGISSTIILESLSYD